MGIDYFEKASDLTMDSGNTNLADLRLLLAFNESTGVTVRDWASYGDHGMITNASEGNWVNRGTNAYALRVNDGEGGLSLFKIPRTRPVMTLGSPRTWAFWVRSESIGMRGDGTDSDTFGYLYFRQTGNQTRFQDDQSFDFFDQIAWREVSTAESGILDCWILTTDGTTSGMRIYKNGVLAYEGLDALFQTGNAHWIFNSNATANYGIEGDLYMTAEWEREFNALDIDTVTTNPLVEMGIDKITGAGGGGGDPTEYTSPDNTFIPIPWVPRAGGEDLSRGRPPPDIFDWLGGAN